MDFTFCQILETRLPSWRVCEDENSIPFLDKGQVHFGTRSVHFHLDQAGVRGPGPKAAKKR